MAENSYMAEGLLIFQSRHEDHKSLKDKPIDEKIMNLATYIGVWYTLDLNNLEELETDLLKGNNFIVNTQHNQ